MLWPDPRISQFVVRKQPCKHFWSSCKVQFLLWVQRFFRFWFFLKCLFKGKPPTSGLHVAFWESPWSICNRPKESPPYPRYKMCDLIPIQWMLSPSICSLNCIVQLSQTSKWALCFMSEVHKYSSCLSVSLPAQTQKISFTQNFHASSTLFAHWL